MGCYDEVKVPCPKCGMMYIAQSKGGNCSLRRYDLNNAPPEVMSDVNRHAPFTCARCSSQFRVQLQYLAIPVLEPTDEELEDAYR